MKINKQKLQIGTVVVWVGVLIGVSLFVDSGPDRNLDWPLIWIIVGGFLIQSTLITFYVHNDEKG